jgi:NDP-sugar pyrophosphorylase family protein
VVDAYRNAINAGEKVLGIDCTNSFWADLGTRERYLNAHRDILAARRKRAPGKSLLPPAQLKKIKSRIPPHTTVNGFAAIGSNVSIGNGVTISDSVI